MKSYIQFVKPDIVLTQLDVDKIKNIIESGWFCDGDYVDDFETYMEQKCNVNYAIACSSATQGLIAALIGSGIKNKKIALPAFTWPSTLHAILCSGNTPVFCDIDEKTWCIDLSTAQEDFDVVMPVDIFGHRSYVKTDVPVIYDAAHGFEIKDLGQRGMVEVVSFSFTKPVICGQGGVILTSNYKIYEAAHEIIKLSAKMLEVSAYLFFLSLDTLHKRTKIKNEIIKKYRKLIKIPFTEQKTRNSVSTYCILLENKHKKDKIVKSFIKNNVEVKSYYEPLINGLSITDNIANRIIALPTYERMLDKVPFIASVINEA